MYGFHKINRVCILLFPHMIWPSMTSFQTPRAQRTSTDAQTWEFSHHKFLRARPDLLEEIKRKALEPDPSIKHRVELPGEVAAQLAQMRDDNRRVVNALAIEKAKTERLTMLTKALYDAFEKNFPGWCTSHPFPVSVSLVITHANVIPFVAPPKPVVVILSNQCLPRSPQTWLIRMRVQTSTSLSPRL
jgi:hypothetical protein